MIHAVLVEDNLITLRALKERVDWIDCGVESVKGFSNGLDAYYYCRENPVDLLIADIVVPGMSGLDLGEKLLREKFLSVILISAHERFEYAQQAIRSGIADYVLKPIDYKELSQKVKKARKALINQRTLKNKLTQMKPLLQGSFARGLLEGDLSLSEIKQEMELLEISESSSHAVVFTIDFQYSGGGNKVYKRTEYHLLVLELLDRIEGIKKNRTIIHYRPVSFQICGIVWIKGDFLAYEELISDLKFVISSKKHWSISAGVGRQVERFDEICDSYEESLTALEYKFFTGVGGVTPYDTITNFRETAKEHKGISHGNEIIVSVESLNHRRFILERENLIHMLDENFMSRTGMILLLMNIVVKIGGVYKNLLLQEKESSPTLDQFKEKINHIFSRMEDLLWNIENTHSRQIILRIHDYVNSHFSNSSIGVQEIAGVVGYTPNYLSSFYKDQTGKNLLDFVQETRIHNARILLNTTDSKISEIAELSGFSNQYYFSVLFKRITGVTPREFRSSQKNN